MNSTVPLGYVWKRQSDDEFVAAAFADWKMTHGLGDGIRLGDLDRKSISQVLDRAQRLKTRAQEPTA